MMNLTFLGTGTAFTVEDDNYQSNMLLEKEKGNYLLIDCGSDARNALHEMGLSYKDIDHVYISHLHADHMGGLEWLAFSRKYDPSCAQPTLYISEFFKEDLYQTLSAPLGLKRPDLSSHFNVQFIKENGSFFWEGLEFYLIRNDHINDNHESKNMPSFGLLFVVGNKTILITTDTQYCPLLLQEFYQRADIIFHDCETSKQPSRVHARFDQLKFLEEKIKKKMWLYHYDADLLPNAQEAGFKGFVKKGQSFDLLDSSTFMNI